jgi:hypothetical protein
MPRSVVLETGERVGCAQRAQAGTDFLTASSIESIAYVRRRFIPNCYDPRVYVHRQGGKSVTRCCEYTQRVNPPCRRFCAKCEDARRYECLDGCARMEVDDGRQ